jgi:hypothetical protein
MRWPLGGEGEMVPFGPVILTEDENRECQAMLDSLGHAEGGRYAIRGNLADSFRRSIIALCMMGRAERFLALSGSQPECKDEACQAAAKACAVFPLSIYFYDFGCILQRVGKPVEARLMFTEFLRRHGTEELDPIMRITLDQRDVREAVRNARRLA